jgi:hypothetical protein
MESLASALDELHGSLGEVGMGRYELVMVDRLTGGYMHFISMSNTSNCGLSDIAIDVAESRSLSGPASHQATTLNPHLRRSNVQQCISK